MTRDFWGRDDNNLLFELKLRTEEFTDKHLKPSHIKSLSRIISN